MNVEDRLRGALAARAALVTPELPPAPLPEPEVPWWRQGAPVLVAAAAVAALILGLVLLPRGAPDPQPLPPIDRTPTDEPVPGVTGELTGDLNGDGADDVVTLVGNELEVTLGNGQVLSARVRRAESLMGFVDLDQETGVAVSHRSGGVGVWVLRTGLTQLPLEFSYFLAVQDGRRMWIDPDGALLDAAYVVGDPPPVTMAVRRWVAAGDVLRSVPHPMHCGDPDSDATPTSCRDNPAGSDAELPMLWTVDGGLGIEEGVLTPPGGLLSVGPWTFSVVGAPEGEDASYSNEQGELVMRGSGVERRIELPPGGVDGIVHVPDSDIVAVLQSREHREQWTFVQTAGDLVFLTEPEDTPIDGHWVGFFERTTWITEDGLFTRETMADFGIHQLWRWEVADGALVPIELGRLCLDDNVRPTAYGAC
ncbi:hypothetical protein [Nocardioides limicola]|uniref:hypothetical protein n=1 Tax=Nocardioides limicola TaxID=2803368 RepID=UPI00193BFE06|nr:hypothetical protein [Nocardioides sp. DJM-14]